jgi:hypothetical protein
MRVIAVTFVTDRYPPGGYNMFIICPLLRFFDSRGQPVFAVCRGWVSMDGDPGSRGKIFWGPAALEMSARLLPAASTGGCLTVRTSRIE